MATKRHSEILEVLDKIGIKEGAKVELTNNGHYRITSTNLTRQVITGGTPSDRRTNLNLKAELRGAMTEKAKQETTRQKYSKEEIELIKEDFKTLSNKEIMKKYQAGASTVDRWKSQANGTIGTRGGNSHYKPREKKPNPVEISVLAQLERGDSPLTVALDHNIPIKRVYNWRASDRKKERELNTDFMKSSKAPDKVKPEEKAAALSADKFNDAIKVMMGASAEIAALKKQVTELTVKNDELKAKFSIMQEAFNL